jgi:putative endopeptidase
VVLFRACPREARMNPIRALSLLLLLTSAGKAHGQASSPSPAASPDAPAPRESGTSSVHSLDLASLDTSVDPCADFYQYSCGGWQKSNPIPPDQTAWSVYGKLNQDTLNLLRSILEESAQPGHQGDALTRQVGDYYAACTDEATVEERGIAPLEPELHEIAGIHSPRELAPLVARLQLAIQGNSLLFGPSSTQDPDDSERQIAGLDQGGLGLPDRDYYTKEDDRARGVRERYVEHIERILLLLGDTGETARRNAQSIMGLETALAKASLTQVERRDPYKLKNKLKVAELAALAPRFDWHRYFEELHAPGVRIVNVTPGAFFREVDHLLATVPIATWRSYLRYHVANAYAPYLPARFVQENFEFYRRYLRGQKELQPRWRRCAQSMDFYLSDALGEVYVRKRFSAELKQSTAEMVRQIEEAMEERIRGLDWMSQPTKEQALQKLHGIRNKIGYPDTWRDYSSVRIVRDDALGNLKRVTQFETRRNLNKIGRPVDHGEWQISPMTVDAYYDDQMNDINFPAAVLQPPLYDPKMDDAPNYGDTGGTIGHELTHGFDDEGRQYDAQGNLRDWWTKADAGQFVERARCVQDQYAQYVIVDDVHINSQLTLGEDVADLGGEILAYAAWKAATRNKDLRPVDGLSPEQRFFIGFAQWDCSNTRPEELRVGALTDPHSPSRFRINGVVVNMPEFAHAFACKAGQAMVKPEGSICRVW